MVRLYSPQVPTSKGFVHLLLLIPIVIIVLIIIGIPIFVSTIILPNIKKETAGNFPATLEARKEYVDKNSEPWIQKEGMKYLGFEAPTDQDIANLKKGTDFTRHYPTSIKAVFDPGNISNTVNLLYYADELADLGVNTYWVIGEYRMKDYQQAVSSAYRASQFAPSFSKLGFPQILNDADANKVLAWRILLAKNLGFATILIPDYPSVFNIGRENFDLQKVEPEFRRVALELAKIAEETGAEYFVPVNEYNHLLISNGYSMDEIVENEKRFYGKLLPEVRKIFHGKIVIKNGAVNDWNNFKRQSMVGADLFGVGNGFTGVRTRENMAPKVEAANFVSARDNVPWFETEFLVYRPIDQENWLGYLESEAPMENTYKEGLDIFEKEAKGAVGFTFMGWTGVGRIRGVPAALVMKDFFSRWQPTSKVSPDMKVVQAALGGQSSFLENLPSYYSFFFKMITGQMKKPDEKDPAMGEGGLPCKGKEECDAYCAKPENRAECEKVKGGGGGEVNMKDGGIDPRLGGPEGKSQGQGPGGCKSDLECKAFCSIPENQLECRKFRNPTPQ